MKTALTLSFLAIFLYGCSDDSSVTVTGKFKGEAWADNWFSMYVGETLVVEDSVPITTERSFNAETFGFDGDYPLVLNLVLKDFKENDTGLEYIGEENQQMGDGGFIAQITDNSTGKLLAASSSSWKCTVIHRAPTNKTCEKDAAPEKTCLSEITEEPAGWKAPGYDVSAWESVKEYTADTIGAKDGYDQITWASEAKLVWTSDLESDNTLLCKVTVASPDATATPRAALRIRRGRRLAVSRRGALPRRTPARCPRMPRATSSARARWQRKSARPPDRHPGKDT